MTHQNQTTESQEVESPTEYSYAGLWRRSAAGIIDVILLLVAIGILMGIENLLDISEYSPLGALFFLFRTLVFLIYFSVMESSGFQATVGKLILGIKVANANGNPVSFQRALGRNAIKMLFFAGFPFFILLLGSYTLGQSDQVLAFFLTALFAVLLAGVLMAAKSGSKQSLHDYAARTIVIMKS